MAIKEETMTNRRLAWLEAQKNSRESLKIYLASSDRDLLNKVEEMMARQGLLGLRDTAGRVQYVIDGRRGHPYAARRFGETIEKFVEVNQNSRYRNREQQQKVIDEVLAGYSFQRTLRGYFFLRQMLLAAVEDPALLHPISKRLYPVTAEHFRVSESQVERNLRYLIDKLAEDGALSPDGRLTLADHSGKRVSVTAMVYILHDQVMMRLIEPEILEKG
jgi:hypothetical protein